MIVDGWSYYRYGLPRRMAGPHQTFGLGSFLAFFSAKVVRGGPKAFLHLAACFMCLVFLIKLLPHRLSNLDRGVWSWRAADIGDDVQKSAVEEDDGSVPGGLRVVVFGQHDVATPARPHGSELEYVDRRSWTELLCEELGCTSYLSFVPPSGTLGRVMTSAELYAASVERVFNETCSPGRSGPGMDYNFMLDQYPVAWNASDLSKQVTEFLSMKKPRHAPAETLWVFSFGMWDIWSLAAEPLDVSRPMIDAIVSHIFVEVERLYESSMNDTSIAWSNSSQLQQEPTRTMRQTAISVAAARETDIRPAQGDNRATFAEGVKNDTGDESAVDRTKHFRILIPKVFDPSLTPGWHSARPDIPAPHSKAEQMRNAATLTNRWNEKIYRLMAAWTKTQEKPYRETVERPKMTGKEAMGVFIESLTTPPLKRPPVNYAKAQVMGGHDHQSPPPRTKRLGDGNEDVKEDIPREPDAEAYLAPERPQRDAILYDLNGYLEELIVDRQLRNAGLKDSRGAGNKPTEDGFLEVWKPCVNDASDDGIGDSDESGEDEAVSPDYDGEDESSGYEQEVALTKRKGVPSTPSHPAIRGRVPPPALSASPTQSPRLRFCEAPQETLFFTPFTVSPRAVEAIARQAADMVRKNETVRARLARQLLAVPFGRVDW